LRDHLLAVGVRDALAAAVLAEDLGEVLRFFGPRLARFFLELSHYPARHLNIRLTFLVMTMTQPITKRPTKLTSGRRPPG
jgi:hypothetical protein